MSVPTESTWLLRKALMLDGVVSGFSGLVLLVAPGPIASFLGAPSAGLVALVGASLLAFGLAVLRNARRETPSRKEAAITVALNAAWLIGTVAVVAAGGLTRQGNWAVLLVADVVLVFAALEVIGLRRHAALRDAVR